MQQYQTPGAEAFQGRLFLQIQSISPIATRGGYYSHPILDLPMLPTGYYKSEPQGTRLAYLAHGRERRMSCNPDVTIPRLSRSSRSSRGTPQVQPWIATKRALTAQFTQLRYSLLRP
jgi:hypothetical protein